MNQLDFIERGGRVQRMHTVPVLHPQSVAAHSFGVAWLCYLLHPTNDPSTNLLMAALQHDLAEHMTGDIPAPAKRLLNIRGKVAAMEEQLINDAGLPFFENLLTTQEAEILAVADALELCQYSLREMKLGNRSEQLTEMFSNAMSYAYEVDYIGGVEIIQRLLDEREKLG